MARGNHFERWNQMLPNRRRRSNPTRYPSMPSPVARTGLRDWTTPAPVEKVPTSVLCSILAKFPFAGRDGLRQSVSDDYKWEFLQGQGDLGGEQAWMGGEAKAWGLRGEDGGGREKRATKWEGTGRRLPPWQRWWVVEVWKFYNLAHFSLIHYYLPRDHHMSVIW
jgi:hypothetical protein